MVGNFSIRVSGIKDVLSSCRALKPGRWGAAGLCVLLGLTAATAIGSFNTAKSLPAQLVALSDNDAHGAVTPSEAIAEIRRLTMTPAALLKAGADLNLAESGLYGDRSAEEFLASAIEIAPSDRASVIDIKVNSGEPAFDTVIANYMARSLSALAPLAQSGNDPIRFSLVSKARVQPAASVLLYQAEIVVLSLLLGAAVIALGLARIMRDESQPVERPVQQASVVPRGILEQIDMLERMWPYTGRQNAMPEGSNDEPEQVELRPARNIVVRMAELRQEALKAIEEPSEEALEDVLTDMQSLRDQVRWITAEQLRRRRNAYGR